MRFGHIGFLFLCANYWVMEDDLEVTRLLGFYLDEGERLELDSNRIIASTDIIGNNLLLTSATNSRNKYMQWSVGIKPENKGYIKVILEEGPETLVDMLAAAVRKGNHYFSLGENDSILHCFVELDEETDAAEYSIRERGHIFAGAIENHAKEVEKLITRIIQLYQSDCD